MGTSLTGTKPKDTYDSLIKVGDNGPISGTAKTLSDGLGNDLPISVSTSNVGIGTSSPARKLDVTGTGRFSDDLTISGSKRLFLNGSTGQDWALRTNSSSGNFDVVDWSTEVSRVSITQAGNVGIGTSTPTAQGANITSLDVAGSAGASLTTRGSTVTGEVFALDSAGGLYISTKTNHPMIFRTNDVERMRLTNNGLTFNGDTAAANALDDYEEGTWTATATPQTSGSITLSSNGGTYTKVGRQVTCTVFCNISSVSSPVGSYVQFGGLPFTSSSSPAARASVSLYFADASTGYTPYVLPSYIPIGLTVFYVFIDASTLASGDEFNAQITYIV